MKLKTKPDQLSLDIASGKSIVNRQAFIETEAKDKDTTKFYYPVTLVGIVPGSCGCLNIKFQFDEFGLGLSGKTGTAALDSI